MPLKCGDKVHYKSKVGLPVWFEAKFEKVNTDSVSITVVKNDGQTWRKFIPFEKVPERLRIVNGRPLAVSFPFALFGGSHCG